jgi:hypothetical protein
MTERFHLRNVLIIQSVPYLNLGSPRQGILTRSSCGSALSTFLFSSDKSGHGAEAVSDRGASRGLVISPCRLLMVDCNAALC